MLDAVVVEDAAVEEEGADRIRIVFSVKFVLETTMMLLAAGFVMIKLVLLRHNLELLPSILTASNGQFCYAKVSGSSL